MPAKASSRAQQSDDEEDEDLFVLPTIIRPDTYLVKCHGIRKKVWDGENRFNKDRENASIMWNLELAKIDDDGNVVSVKDENTDEPYINEFPTTTSFGPKSKAFKYATAFLKRPPTNEEAKRLNSLVTGKKAMAVFGQKENGYPEIVDIFPFLGKS